MHVRPLDRSDLDSAGELLAQLGYRVPGDELAGRIERVLGAGTHYAAVVEGDGRVVGLVHAYERPSLEGPFAVVVQALVVEAEARRRGIARLLLESVEAWARARASPRVVLHARIDREEARLFYERLGYARAATSHLMIKRLGEVSA
jgi:GNAT superfamily N-acetyltransferase